MEEDCELISVEQDADQGGGDGKESAAAEDAHADSAAAHADSGAAHADIANGADSATANNILFIILYIIDRLKRH